MTDFLNTAGRENTEGCMDLEKIFKNTGDIGLWGLNMQEKNMEFTIRTKEDLERAKKEMPKVILFEGEVAEKIQKVVKAKKTGKKVAHLGIIAGAVAIVGGMVAAPFTGGATLGVSALGAKALGVTVIVGRTIIVLTTAQLAIVAGVVCLALGVSLSIAKDLLKSYDFEIGNGTVKCTRKICFGYESIMNT